MRNRVLQFMKQNQICWNKKIICAVSGGVDSICLLHILHNLGFDVVLAHVNHHKRLESEVEEQAMKELAEYLKVPFEVFEYHYDHQDNFHNDAHYARYQFFLEMCKKYDTDIIATAHHLDDQIETILMKILEGSNLYGYGGISVCNNDGQKKIIRPLLCCSKEELYLYAKEQNYVYFEDSSNNEDDFLRNRIRHHIVPLLKQESDNFYEKVYQYSTQVKEAFAYIRKQSIEYLNKTNNTIDLTTYQVLDIAVKKDIISLLLEQKEIRKNNRIIHNILGLLQESTGTKNLILENGYQMIRSYGTARIEKVENLKRNEIQVSINDVKMYENFGKFYFSKKNPQDNAKTMKLCYNSLELPLIVRPKKDGDEIELPIGKKKVSRIFIDSKIPKDKRNSIPIITDANGKILWVYGVARAKDVLEQKDTGDIYFVCEETING